MSRVSEVVMPAKFILMTLQFLLIIFIAVTRVLQLLRLPNIYNIGRIYF